MQQQPSLNRAREFGLEINIGFMGIQYIGGTVDCSDTFLSVLVKTSLKMRYPGHFQSIPTVECFGECNPNQLQPVFPYLTESSEVGF